MRTPEQKAYNAGWVEGVSICQAAAEKLRAENAALRRRIRLARRLLAGSIRTDVLDVLNLRKRPTRRGK